MSGRFRKLHWLALALPLIAVSLSSCVVAPYPAYPAHVYYWHDRAYWR